MLRHRIFIGATGGLLAGVTLAIFMPAVAWFSFGVGTIALLIIVLGTARIRDALLACIVVLFGAMGLLRGEDAMMLAHAAHQYDGATVRLSGIVLQDPLRSAFQQRVIFGVHSCVLKSGDTCAVKKVLLRTSRYAEGLSMRSGLRVTCTLTPVKNFSETFDYVMYLAAKGVRYTCDAQNITTWQNGNLYDRVYRALASMRMYMEAIVMRNVTQPQGALTAGLLFGGDGRLSQAWQDKFSTTGLTHIVAVSGYNVTVIAHALILFGIFIGLWRWQATWLAIAGIVIFVAMIGAPAAAVRAGIMGVTVLLLLSGGRMGSALPALLLAGTVMAVINPLIVRYDIGFQLSFLATLGIIVVYPIMERFVQRRDQSLGIGEIVLVTMSAQIFVVPVIAYHFHTFALYSLFANILILPLIPIAMAVASVMIVGGMVSVWWAMWGGWIISILLSWVFVVVDFFAKAPYASLHIEHLSLWWIVIWYSIVGGILFYGRRNVTHCNHQ